MTVLSLAFRTVTRDDVLRAQATHFALILAERDDPRLADDPAHQAARHEARVKYLRLFAEWAGT